MNIGALQSTINGLDFDGKMPKYSNGQKMMGALDEPSGLYTEDGRIRDYALELFNHEGESMQKIFWVDLAPIFVAVGHDIIKHGVITSVTTMRLEGATANNVILRVKKPLCSCQRKKQRPYFSRYDARFLFDHSTNFNG